MGTFAWGDIATRIGTGGAIVLHTWNLGFSFSNCSYTASFTHVFKQLTMIHKPRYMMLGRLRRAYVHTCDNI